MTNFAVSFELEQRAFSWQKFDQQRQLHHCKNNVLEQVCQGYLIKLKLKTNKIAFCDLAQFEELGNLLFEVNLPPQPAQIASFYPVLSPDGTRLLIALSYGRDNQMVWTDDKHTGLILVDITRRRSQSILGVNQSFRESFFANDDLVILQTREGLMSIDIATRLDLEFSSYAAEEEDQERQHDDSDPDTSRYDTDSEPEYGIEEDLMFDFEVKQLLSTNLASAAPGEAADEHAPAPGMSLEKKLIVSVEGDTMLVFDVQSIQLQTINWEKAAQLQKRRSGQSLSAFDLNLKVKCQLEYPEGLGDHSTMHKKWAVCRVGDGRKVHVLLATSNFSWVYTLVEQIGEYSVQAPPILVTQRGAVAVLPVNLEQVAV